MIIHNIIKHVVPPPAPYVPAPYIQPQNTLMTVDELSATLKQYAFEVGDFVTMARYASALYNIHCVVCVQNDHKQLQYARYKAAPYLFCQAATAADVPWVRWDAPSDYRLLTEEEFDRLIGHNHDNLRNYCFQKSKPYLPASTTQESCSTNGC